ncbi:MAG: tetratricopeptide repeat protein [Pirellulales bacterium]|nr:tetratricopeptide repeat protein [Pirellulales bacterium]
MTKLRIVIVGLVLVGGLLLVTKSCDQSGPSRVRLGGSRRSAESGRSDSTALINAIARGLNNLPEEVALELQPPFPVLDDAKSVDRKEVLATCDVTPDVPDGPYNYLHVPKGNAGFRSLKVRSGDLVRYFVVYTQEDQEHGVQQQTYLELVVRRLDANNPQNALIIEGGLNAPMPIPSRIEVWRFSDKRMNEIRFRLNRYVSRPKDLLGWEPSPDESALILLHDRLNQWLRNLPQDDATWEASPLLTTLPAELRETKYLQNFLTPAALRTGLFEPTDPRLLQQAIWLRDIAQWAKGDGLTDLDAAQALFDWTVRNIQLDDPQGSGVVHRPWQALMYGHGTAAQRAWVFAELCRQQQLDVVMLSFAADGEQVPRRWLPALLSAGKLYLFDAQLGLPLPGKEPGSVATLSDVTADPLLLRALDLDEDRTYPLAAKELQHVEAYCIASPLQLSRRAALLQKELTGENFAIVAANIQRITAALQQNQHLAEVRLWPQPFQAFLEERAMTKVQRQQAARRFLAFAQRPRLWKARVLHFQGTKEIPVDQRNDPLAEPDRGHEKATALYVDPRIRPPKVLLDRIEPAKQMIYNRVKADASYWQGLLRYDLGDYKVAVNWLKDMTLQANPDGPWTAGARYNLARAYQATGQIEEAIELLTADDSPQSYGNALRARRLEAMTKE